MFLTSPLIEQAITLIIITSQSTCLFNRFAPLFGEVTIGRLTDQNPSIQLSVASELTLSQPVRDMVGSTGSAAVHLAANPTPL